MVCDVVIAGAGPNGLMLACELRLAGVRPVVLERLSEPSPVNRANGLVGQVVRMLDRRGLYQPLAGESGPPRPMPAFFFGAVPMDVQTLIGRWAPDLLLDTGNGPVRLADLTTTARPLLLDCTENACLAPEADGWRDRVDIVTARTRDTAVTGLLLRPDCYIAWATDTPHPGPDERESLLTMLSTWFGGAEQPPRSRPDPSHSGSPRVGGDQVQS
jgi:hypothetical protein